MTHAIRITLLAVLALSAACSSDTPDSGCAQTCEAQTEQGCNLLSTADCTELCEMIFDAASDDCQQALADKSACMLEQPDICNLGTACDAEDQAVDRACN